MRLSIILFGLLFLLSCKKISEADERLYVRGRISLKDTVSNKDIEASRENFVVKITDDIEMVEYLYSVKTNADGYFVFDIPSRMLGNTLYIFSSGQVNNEHYKSGAHEAVKNDNAEFQAVKLVLKTDTDKSLLLSLTTFDKNNLKLPNVKLYFYTSKDLSDKELKSAASYSYTTNQDAIVRIKNIPSGTYYINAIADYDPTYILKTISSSLIVPAIGLQTHSLVLQ